MSDLPIVLHDYETRSGYDLSEVGRIKYVKHKDAAIICMSHKLFGSKEPTKLWLPGAPTPHYFLEPEKYRFAALNIQFDSYITETLGSSYGMKPIPFENQIDTMAVAARFGLPQKLDRLGHALKVKLPKLATGNALKKIFCSPPYHDPSKSREWNMDKLKQFYAYCIRDSDCMEEIMQKMPMHTLPASEQKIWMENCKMNRRGVPVDHPAVSRIDKVCDYYRADQAKLVPALTNGVVQTIGQVAKIQEWAKGFHVELLDLKAQTVDDTIKDLERRIDYGEDESEKLERVRNLLLLRQRIGGAAVKKYKKLDSQTTEGRIHDNSRYHGAGTGRTTGGGFQYLNLPRAQLSYDKDSCSYDEAVEAAIKSFYDTTVLKNKNPLDVAKALVRPMIKAGNGKTLAASDWSSIEYILLMWFSGEVNKVEAFARGEDPYIRFATKLFGCTYEEVTKEQRQRAKPPVLGSGYMLGAAGLVEYSEGYGVTMTHDESQFATNTYRTNHPLVVNTWYKLKDAAHNAVKFPGRTFATHNTRFKVVKNGQFNWLIMTLLSGRHLFYCDPTLVDGVYGTTIKHRGTDPKTKQWGWVYLNPQRIIENIIQGLGRDVLTHGYDLLVANGFTPIMTVYDEIVCEEPEETANERLKEMERLMCVLPHWAKGLVLKADGYVSKRYKKG